MSSGETKNQQNDILSSDMKLAIRSYVFNILGPPSGLAAVLLLLAGYVAGQSWNIIEAKNFIRLEEEFVVTKNKINEIGNLSKELETRGKDTKEILERLIPSDSATVSAIAGILKSVHDNKDSASIVSFCGRFSDSVEVYDTGIFFRKPIIVSTSAVQDPAFLKSQMPDVLGKSVHDTYSFIGGGAISVSNSDNNRRVDLVVADNMAKGDAFDKPYISIYDKSNAYRSVNMRPGYIKIDPSEKVPRTWLYWKDILGSPSVVSPK